MTDGTYDMLLDAIARSAGAVLSLPTGRATGALKHHKSRFLSEGPSGFWVAAAPGEQRLVDSLIASQQPAGISFRSGHLKVVFASPIQRRESTHRIHSTGFVDALLLSFPSEIRAVQRRTSYRVAVPPGAEITARVWRIPPQAHLPARPLASQEVACELHDISVAGVGLTFRGAAPGRPPEVSTDDRLRIELTYPAGKVLVEGRMRYPAEAPTEDHVRAGVQFQHAEDSRAGRQTQAQLTRVVGELQREEVRRVRLGLCNAG